MPSPTSSSAAAAPLTVPEAAVAPETGAARPPEAGEAEAPAPSFSPLYQQIKALLVRSLQAGEWKPGEAIPSEMDLAVRFKVSQGTVRKAIDELATENLLVRRQGKGTFVATHAEAQTQFRFLRLKPDGPQEGGTEREFLECKRVRAPSEVARALELKAGEPAVFLRRTLSFNGKPVVLDDIWLPGALFKGLSAERLQVYRGPLYALFEQEFGVRMLRAVEKLRAVNADAASAALLKVPEGTALLSVERLSLTYDDRPVELRRGLYHTESHYYSNELN